MYTKDLPFEDQVAFISRGWRVFGNFQRQGAVLPSAEETPPEAWAHLLPFLYVTTTLSSSTAHPYRLRPPPPRPSS